MNKLFPLTILFLITAFSCSNPEYKHPDSPIKEVPFTSVKLDDNFWLPRIETNRKISIPAAFKECEINGRFDNFAIAGGLKKGEHRGDFSFDDTDPYKIIEGASYSLAAKYDEVLDSYLDSVITLIKAAQEPDGYLTTCVTNKCYRISGWWGRSRWEKLNSHELYNCGHLYEAAVAHYISTGKRTLLDIATKNADLICEVFGPEKGQKHVPSGHPIVEMGLAKLYKVTGKQKYLDLAKYFVEETGRGTDGHRLNMYSQDHMPILNQEEIVGHAVRAGYLYSGVADVASLTNDTAYFNALTGIWENMASRKLYITGGIGSRAQGEGFGPDYELHNHTAYCETCASIANIYWNHRMFLATGDSKYVDIVERALYNGVISGVSLSGDKFFYDNPLESLGQHERQRWFGCACCPGNITRFMASVPNYVYATRANDIYVNLFMQSSSKIKTSDNSVFIYQKTTYPWDGKITLEISPEKESVFAVHVRIPGWASDKPVPSDLYSYEVHNGNKYNVTVNSCTGNTKKYITHSKAEKIDRYITFEREWKKGDKIEIDFPMDIHQVIAHQNVVDNRGKYAIERGPVVYCLEGKDQPDNKIFNRFICKDFSPSFEYDSTLLNGVVKIKGKGIDVDKTGLMTEVDFVAIPYSTWNNRGNDQMAVWIANNDNTIRKEPDATIASKATSVMVKAPIQKDAPASASVESYAFGVNDQWEPKGSDDTSKPYHYWWLKRGTTETLAYNFDKSQTVSSIDVYWLDFDHYDGHYRVPEYWSLYYKKGDKWVEVKNKDPYNIDKDKYNRVSFEPVTTSALKIEAKLQENVSGGIIEWKVYN